MTWDFRDLIRRGGGRWPRSWRRDEHHPLRAPDVGSQPEAGGQTPEASSQEADERWLPPPWRPPEGDADAWRKPG